MIVGVCGAGGTMGAGIAITAARAGFRTICYDAQFAGLERAAADTAAFFGASVKRGKMTEADRDAALGAMTRTTEMAALAECDLVVEAVFEELAVKQALFRALDKICPAHTIFASNTSTLSITEIASGCGREDRVVGLHYCLPAQLMKLIEVSPGINTSAATLDAAWAFTERQRAAPGADRRTSPASSSTRCWCRSTTTRSGWWRPAWRTRPAWTPRSRPSLGYKMGPLELIDLVGLDTQVRLCEAFYPITLDPRAAAPPLLRRMVAAGSPGPQERARLLSIRGRQDVRRMSYTIVANGPSRSFPGDHALLADAAAEGDVLVLLGRPVLQPDPARTAILVELGGECLGVHTGEGVGEEG